MSLNKINMQGGRSEIRLRLSIFGTESAGILEIILADGIILPVPLKARHIKLLIIYNNALIADRKIEYEPARGWLTNEQIADMYDKEYPKNPVPGENVFTVYRSQINNSIKEEMSRQYPIREAPSIFYSERNVGTRLVCELEIIDLRGRDSR